jgi:hypothetical protein
MYVLEGLWFKENMRLRVFTIDDNRHKFTVYPYKIFLKLSVTDLLAVQFVKEIDNYPNVYDVSDYVRRQCYG